MTKLAAVLSTCLALGLVAAGCGGGDNNGGGGSAKTTEQKQSGGGGAQTASVTMKNIQFNPKSISVAKGGTVKWTNDDGVGHDVTGAGFKSGSAGGIGPGASYSHKFNQVGSIEYRCTVHPGMQGTVVVK